MSENLPILEEANTIVSTLREERRLVVTAPTGSGKSTQLPQMLLDSNDFLGQILVLEPRRIAARMLAHRVASERTGRVGDEVGYAVRFDDQTSAATRIAYLTEGLLLRRLLREPHLPGVSALIFDEFHERNLEGDLALALAKRLTETVRPSLAILVTSATISAEPLCEYLGNCPLVDVEGRTYPVEIAHLGGGREEPVWELAAREVARQAANTEGDFLVFMPGAYEIRRTISLLEGSSSLKSFDLFPLFGDLSSERQDAAVRPSDRRKVVVATNVAETSLTIDGIRVVIDSGLAKKARFDACRGINCLLPEPISRASADQRAGRAGRTAPGRCIRLWSEKEHERRPEEEVPEVLRMDLSEMILTLHAADLNSRKLSWFEAPEEESLVRAEYLLTDLGALDKSGVLTQQGLSMAAFPMHPRQARAMLEARDRDSIHSVALALALAQGRPIILPLRDKRLLAERDRLLDVSSGETESDFLCLLRAWDYAAERNFDPSSCRELGIHAGRCREADRLARRLLSLAGAKHESGSTCDPVAFAKSILSAFPEHVGKRRNRGTLVYALANGKNGELRRQSVARHADFIVAAELDEIQLRGQVGLVLGLATEIQTEWLAEIFPNAIENQVETIFDKESRTVVSRRSTKFRELLLSEELLGEPTHEEAARVLAEEIMSGRLRPKKWDAKAERFVARVNFAVKHCPELEIQPLDEDARRMLFEQFCLGERTWRPLRNKEMIPVLLEWLTPEQAIALPSLVPEEFSIPNKKRPVRLRYDPDGEVTLAASVQELYDLEETPTIAGARYLLRIEILGPNRRPVQITRDLSTFWRDSYPAIKDELGGRYPKHEWR